MQNVDMRPEFPRPDFVRSDWMSLNGEWEFSFDTDVYDKRILVPYCYGAPLSGIGVWEDHDVVWYRRGFTVDAGQLAGRVLLKFGAVDYEAKVWVNGVPAGGHIGGHTSFTLDVTGLVKAGANEVVVKVTDTLATDKPRGKQSWQGKLFGCWYTPTTGIWQSVWLEFVPEVYLERIKITPDVDKLTALCELFLSADGETVAELEVAFTVEGVPYRLGTQQVICRHGYGKAMLCFEDFDLRRNGLLWTPEQPNLIDVTVRVKNEAACDEVGTYFGMRSIGMKGGRLTLNGDIYFQRLVLDQGYWPESLITPPSDEAIRKDIELTKAMGFNGARKHQKIEDPRYYYWADKLGLLVWGEMPSAYLFNDRAISRTAGELYEFLWRDYNHPCIVAWVPVNESWGVRGIVSDTQQQDYSRMLLYMLKALDPTRIVSANDGWEQPGETDLCAVHDYALFPDTIDKYDDFEKLLETGPETRLSFAQGGKWNGQPVMITEYGGIAYATDTTEEGAWGYYGNVATDEEFLRRLGPITEFQIRDGRFSGYCYTQLTDVMQEVNGLLREDRTPKLPIEELRRIFAMPVYGE